MRTTKVKPVDAQAAYENNAAQVGTMLEKIQGQVEKHAENSTNAHWGHVGDLANVLEKLREIESFLG